MHRDLFLQLAHDRLNTLRSEADIARKVRTRRSLRRALALTLLRLAARVEPDLTPIRHAS